MMQQPIQSSAVTSASTIFGRYVSKFALRLLVACLISPSLRAQNAPTTGPAGQAFIPPEKGVQIQLKRPWTARPDVAGSDVHLYGADLTVPSPVFTVAEANKRCSWLYTLAIPIDVNKYPIAVMRYRAKNINPKSIYALRVDSGTAAPGCCKLFAGAELVSDGEIHEVKKDLRDFKVTEPLALIGIGVQSGNDLPATLELLDLHFDAPDDAPVDLSGDDTAISVNVVDEQDNPVAKARVLVDAERRNFTRFVSTDESGNATITPRKNESDTHMLSVTAPGMTTVEVQKAEAGNEPVKVKLAHAKPYGGVAKVDDKPVDGVMVLATIKGDAAEGTQELRTYSTITDPEGRWLTPPLNADVEQISLTMSRADGASVTKTDLDANEAQAAATDVRRELMKARIAANGGRIAPAGGAVQIQIAPGGKAVIVGGNVAAPGRVLAIAAPAVAAAATTAPIEAAAPAAEKMPAAEKSIVLELAREWTPHPDWGGNDEANVYGVNFTDGHPIFSTREPTKSCVFTYPLALPIDIAKYPFVVMRYRAKNLNATEHYTLRVESGAGQHRNIMRFGGGDEVKADGEIHELKKDMRESGATDPISQVCIALQCGEQAPATLEVLELRFDAAGDAANTVPDDQPIDFVLLDQNGKPVGSAVVSMDYERRNFARMGTSTGTGKLTITPRKNESDKHSVMITAKDFAQEEVRDISADNGPITVKLTPGKVYGDTANVDGQPIAGAMVLATIKANPEEDHRWLPSYATITDEKGRWAVPMALTADASQVSLSLVTSIEGQTKSVDLVSTEAQAHGADVLKQLAQGTALAQAISPSAPATNATNNGLGKILAAGVVGASGQREYPLLGPTVPTTKEAGTGANEALPPQEKAVVLDIHRPWLAGPMWDGNEPPKAYGENLNLPEPRFTVIDANTKSFWLYKPALPIDLSKYPILKIRYRATNTQTQGDGYVLRLVQGDVLQVLKSTELTADGKVHEFTKDLREIGGQRKLTNIGMWVNAGEKGNASFDLVGLMFAAPDDAPLEKIKDVNAITVTVTSSDKPVSGAKVTLDGERQNFSRSGTTDGEGHVTINLRELPDDLHLVHVEKDGLYPTDRRFNANDNLNVDVDMVAGSRYGGIARGADNKVLVNAMVTATASNDLDAQTQTPARSTVLTDSQGRWVTPVLPAIDGMSINITPPGGGDAIEVDLARAKEQGGELWTQLSKSMALASNTPTAEPTPPASEEPKGKHEDKEKKTSTASAANIDATILKVDESSVGGKIAAMDGKQLTLKADKETKTIPLADVQEITLKSNSSSGSNDSSSNKSGLSNAQLELANNDHFKGSIKKWEEKKIAIALAAAPSVTVDVPVDQARQLWLGTADQVKKAQALNEKPGVEDIAFVVKDDQVIAVRGVSLGVEGDALKFRFNDEERKIAVNRLAGVTFGRSEDAPVDRAFRQSFQFANDDVISGAWTGLTKDSATATTTWGDPMKLPVKQLVKIRASNGRVVYLSDLKPTQVEQVPYFDRMLPYQVDKSLNGKPLQLTEGPIAKGIAVHSRTVLHYDLGGQFDEFRAKLGFQQPEGKLGDADIRVLGDGKGIFEKLSAKGDQPSTDVNVKVGGVKELVLEVDFGKNQDVGDRVVWGNARLLRAQLPQQTNAAP
jgi:hypothetical protein